MFLRSGKNNIIVNVAKIDYPIKSEKHYRRVPPPCSVFYVDFGYCKWNYNTEKQRNSEYDWVISQLDCRVNEENVTGPVITENKTELLTCACGDFPMSTLFNTGCYQIKCGCGKTVEKLSEEQAELGWNEIAHWKEEST